MRRCAASDALPDRRLVGYKLPPEDADHERTFMQWPVSLDVYDKPSLLRVQAKIALIANTISRFEPVVMLASGPAAKAARSQLGPGVDLWDIPRMTFGVAIPVRRS